MLAHCFFFIASATTEIYTLSLHDALPIWRCWVAASRSTRTRWTRRSRSRRSAPCATRSGPSRSSPTSRASRSEEHTSELQSHSDLVCRLLLEKKKKKQDRNKENTEKSIQQ